MHLFGEGNINDDILVALLEFCILVVRRLLAVNCLAPKTIKIKNDLFGVHLIVGCVLFCPRKSCYLNSLKIHSDN